MNTLLVMVDQPTREQRDLYEGAGIELPQRPDRIEYSAMDRWANEAHETASVDLDDPGGLTALRRAYYALVSYVDGKLGELLGALERTGRAEDTVVVFTSDHGDMLAERRMVQRFDPDRIAADGAAGVRRREVIRDAMARNGTSWDSSPFFDATKQYVR